MSTFLTPYSKPPYIQILALKYLLLIRLGGGRVVSQLATEPVEPKLDADIWQRHCKSLIASVSRVRASATGSSGSHS